MPPKNPKVELGLKNLAILPSYFDYFFVHQRQKVRLRPKLSLKFFSTLGPNPTRKARPDLQLCLKVLDIIQSSKKLAFKKFTVIFNRVSWVSMRSNDIGAGERHQ